MDLFDREVLYKALLEKDSSFEGFFYAGIKTTGIFCRPTCKAKKPKRENVEFFKTAKRALDHGYRPCKLCRPLEKPGKTPEAIQSLINDIAQTPSDKLNEQDLRGRGLNPDTVRRWFKKHHGITFHEYQRMVRINTAFKKIRNGESVTSAAYDSGYESLSGFNESFRNVFGISPSGVDNHNVIDIGRIETPAGPMICGAGSDGICLLEFTDRRMLETEITELAKRLNATPVPGTNPFIDQTRQELHEYFEGERSRFTVPLMITGTPFQKKVWEQLRMIPYGVTRSYKDQAQAIGKPKAVRAVANANGMNKIAIIIPCHRIIGSDGKLTGYGGGLWRKKLLLDLEQRFQQKFL